jgi:hypothetical protein
MELHEIRHLHTVAEALTTAGIEFYHGDLDWIPVPKMSSVQVYSFSIHQQYIQRAKDLIIPGYECVLVRGDVATDSYLQVDWLPVEAAK